MSYLGFPPARPFFNSVVTQLSPFSKRVPNSALSQLFLFLGWVFGYFSSLFGFLSAVHKGIHALMGLAAFLCISAFSRFFSLRVRVLLFSNFTVS
jgi:hypothetical protein